MSDIITTICARIALIGKGVPGINQEGVFDPPPANIDTAHLPALYCLTGNAAHDEESGGEEMVETQRRFSVQVVVMPTGQGNPNTRETLCRPLIAATLAQFRKYSNLNSLDYVMKISVGSDTGIVILPEYGGKFIGFQIPIDVTYLDPRS